MRHRNLSKIALSIVAFIINGASCLSQSIWSHNGSEVLLEASGNFRRFSYILPRYGLPAQRGDVLFEGERKGVNYEGTAYLFSKACGKIGYHVSGYVSQGERSVTMSGLAPRRDNNCNIVSYFQDNLKFNYVALANQIAISKAQTPGSRISEDEHVPAYSPASPFQTNNNNYYNQAPSPSVRAQLNNVPTTSHVQMSEKDWIFVSMLVFGGFSACAFLYFYFTDPCPKCGTRNSQFRAEGKEVLDRQHKYRRRNWTTQHFNGNYYENVRHSVQEPYYEQTVRYEIRCKKCGTLYFPVKQEAEN